MMDLTTQLSTLRHQLNRRTLRQGLWHVAWCGLCAAMGWLVIARWQPQPWLFGLAVAAGVVGITGLLHQLRRGWLQPAPYLRSLETRFHLQERLLTQQEFAGQPHPPAFYPLLLHDLQSRLEMVGRDQPRVRWRPPAKLMQGLTIMWLLLWLWPQAFSRGVLQLAQALKLPTPPTQSSPPPQPNPPSSAQQSQQSQQSQPSQQPRQSQQSQPSSQQGQQGAPGSQGAQGQQGSSGGQSTRTSGSSQSGSQDKSGTTQQSASSSAGQQGQPGKQGTSAQASSSEQAGQQQQAGQGGADGTQQRNAAPGQTADSGMSPEEVSRLLEQIGDQLEALEQQYRTEQQQQSQTQQPQQSSVGQDDTTAQQTQNQQASPLDASAQSDEQNHRAEQASSQADGQHQDDQQQTRQNAGQQTQQGAGRQAGQASGQQRSATSDTSQQQAPPLGSSAQSADQTQRAGQATGQQSGQPSGQHAAGESPQRAEGQGAQDQLRALAAAQATGPQPGREPNANLYGANESLPTAGDRSTSVALTGGDEAAAESRQGRSRPAADPHAAIDDAAPTTEASAASLHVDQAPDEPLTRRYVPPDYAQLLQILTQGGRHDHSDERTN